MSFLTPMAIATVITLLMTTPRTRPNKTVRCATRGFTSTAPARKAISVVSRSSTWRATKVHRESTTFFRPAFQELLIPAADGCEEIDPIQFVQFTHQFGNFE